MSEVKLIIENDMSREDVLNALVVEKMQEIEKLKAVLKPFAEFAESFRDSDCDYMVMYERYMSKEIRARRLTFGDFRKAQELLRGGK